MKQLPLNPSWGIDLALSFEGTAGVVVEINGDGSTNIHPVNADNRQALDFLLSATIDLAYEEGIEPEELKKALAWMLKDDERFFQNAQ